MWHIRVFYPNQWSAFVSSPVMVKYTSRVCFFLWGQEFSPQSTSFHSCRMVLSRSLWRNICKQLKIDGRCLEDWSLPPPPSFFHFEGIQVMFSGFTIAARLLMYFCWIGLILLEYSTKQNLSYWIYSHLGITCLLDWYGNGSIISVRVELVVIYY